MMWRMDKRSLLVGAVMGAGLCVLIGAAKDELAGAVGRYRVSCSQSNAYLVDTVTGQVWLNSEREFRTPKLRTGMAVEKPPIDIPTTPSPAVQNPTTQSPLTQTPTLQSPAPAKPPVTRTPTVETPKAETRPTSRPNGFIGKWVLKHPTQGEFSIQILSDGRAILANGNQKSEGKWTLEGNQVTITTDRESVTAQLDDQGRLLVKQGDSEPIAFQFAE